MGFLIFLGVVFALIFGVRALSRYVKGADHRKTNKERKDKSALDNRFHELLTARGFTLKGKKAASQHEYTRVEPNKDVTTVALKWESRYHSSPTKSLSVTRCRKKPTGPGSYVMALVWSGGLDFLRSPGKNSYAHEKTLLKRLKAAEKAANKDIIEDSF